MTKTELPTTGETLKVPKDGIVVIEGYGGGGGGNLAKDGQTHAIKVLDKPEQLLEHASQLNKLSEVSQVALGMCLVKIKEEELYKEAGYEEWHDYYQQELGRSKGDISRLLKVGKLLIEGGFREDTVPELSYTKFYAAHLSFPEQPVEYLIAASQTNTLAELADGSRDKFGEHPPEWEAVFKCKTCGKVTSNQDNHA